MSEQESALLLFLSVIMNFCALLSGITSRVGIYQETDIRSCLEAARRMLWGRSEQCDQPDP